MESAFEGFLHSKRAVVFMKISTAHAEILFPCCP